MVAGKHTNELALFTYSTKHLLYKDKVRFYYILKGRDGKSGIITNLNIKQLGRTVLLVPHNQADKVENILRDWKCTYTRRTVFQ